MRINEVTRSIVVLGIGFVQSPHQSGYVADRNVRRSLRPWVPGVWHELDCEAADVAIAERLLGLGLGALDGPAPDRDADDAEHKEDAEGDRCRLALAGAARGFDEARRGPVVAAR